MELEKKKGMFKYTKILLNSDIKFYSCVNIKNLGTTIIRIEMPSMASKISGGTKKNDTDNFINLNYKSNIKENKEKVKMAKTSSILSLSLSTHTHTHTHLLKDSLSD